MLSRGGRGTPPLGDMTPPICGRFFMRILAHFQDLSEKKKTINMSTEPPTTPSVNDNDSDEDIKTEAFGTPVGSPAAVQFLLDESAPDSGALPSYLVQTVARGKTINMDDVLEDVNEEGPGGDSDNEADSEKRKEEMRVKRK